MMHSIIKRTWLVVIGTTCASWLEVITEVSTYILPCVILDSLYISNLCVCCTVELKCRPQPLPEDSRIGLPSFCKLLSLNGGI